MKYEIHWDLDEPRYDDPDSPNKIDLGVYYYDDPYAPKRFDLGAYHCDSEPDKAYLWIRYNDNDGIHGMPYKRAIRFIINGKKYDHTDSAMAVCIERFVYTLLHDIKWHTDEVKSLDDAAESD